MSIPSTVDVCPNSTRLAIRVSTKVVSQFILYAVLASLAFLFTGCAWPDFTHHAAAPVTQPRNFYRSARYIPVQIRRLAVLPVTVESADWQAEEGRKELEPVLFAELGKLNAFELVAVTPTQLREWTGKAGWNAQEKLPSDFFEHLQNVLSCDAVLFSHLRPYRAYKPLVLGWNLKIVETKDKSILWAADEVFDASEAVVARAAEGYCREHVENVKPLADSSSILNSPRRFSQYTLSALLATLPER